MNYQSIHDYCKDISQNLGISTKHVHAEKSYINTMQDYDKGLMIWSLPFTSSGGTSPYFSRTWVLQLIFYQQDLPDSSFNANDTEQMQEAIRTIANTDHAAEKFLRLFNGNSISDALEYASDNLTINSFTTSPAIRDTAKLLTGTLLTINVTFGDNFDYCCIDNAT